MSDSERRENIKSALGEAQNAQERFWDAMNGLESALGFDLDNLDDADLSDYDVDSLLAMADGSPWRKRG